MKAYSKGNVRNRDRNALPSEDSSIKFLLEKMKKRKKHLAAFVMDHRFGSDQPVYDKKSGYFCHSFVDFLDSCFSGSGQYAVAVAVGSSSSSGSGQWQWAGGRWQWAVLVISSI